MSNNRIPDIIQDQKRKLPDNQEAEGPHSSIKKGCQVCTGQPLYLSYVFSVEGHVRLPDFPHLAYKIGAGLEGHFPRFPAGRGSLCALAVSYKLKGL